MRRRKKTITEEPLTSSQTAPSSSGVTASPEPSSGREIAARPLPGFEVREGDRLTVMYQGAKLQIAPFSTVELDGGIYSRTLLPGDDPAEQWDRIYGYLERKALEVARPKLQAFALELAEAKEIAKGNR